MLNIQNFTIFEATLRNFENINEKTPTKSAHIAKPTTLGSITKFRNNDTLEYNRQQFIIVYYIHNNAYLY